MNNTELIKKFKENAERQNQEINKLIDRDKIMVEMIKQNTESIIEIKRDFHDMLKRRQF